MLHVNRILRELDLDAMKEADCFLVFSFNKPVIKVLLEGGKNMYIKVLFEGGKTCILSLHMTNMHAAAKIKRRKRRKQFHIYIYNYFLMRTSSFLLK